MSERLLTAAQVAESLAVQPATVQRWVEDGKLRAYRLGGSKGGRLRIPESALEEFLLRGATSLESATTHLSSAVQ